MATSDADAIRTAFIQRQLNRAMELASAGRSGSDERARRAREAALKIVREFRRYCEWCAPTLSERDRTSFHDVLRRVELALGSRAR